MILSAVDPANPYGTILPWPESTGRPQRTAGAYVLLDDGDLVGYLNKNGTQLLSFGAVQDNNLARQTRLVELLKMHAQRVGTVTLRKVDGCAVLESPLLAILESVGFRRTVNAVYWKQGRAEEGRELIGRFADW